MIKDLITNNKFGHAITYHGQVDNKEGRRIAFRDIEKYKFFICQEDCGIGMNELVVADTAIYYSNSIKLESRLQSMKRTRRIGSEQHKQITYMDIVAKGTYDEDILEALNNNQEVLEFIMDKKR